MPNREEIHNCSEQLLGQSNGMTASTRTTAMSGSDNDIKLTAKTAGPIGDLISLTLVNPAVTGTSALSIAISGSVGIVASLGTATSGVISTTANDLISALEGDSQASLLVTPQIASGNTGSGVVTALTKTNLSGGATTAATLNSVSLDCDGFDSAHFNLHIGDFLSSGLTYEVQDSDDNSTFAAADATSVVDDAPTPVANKTIRVAYVGKKRYARLSVVPAAATDMIVTGHRGYASHKPVTNPL